MEVVSFVYFARCTEHLANFQKKTYSLPSLTRYTITHVPLFFKQFKQKDYHYFDEKFEKTLMSCIEGGKGHLSKRSTFKVPAAQVQQHCECYNESDDHVDFYVGDDDDDDNY